MHHQSWCLEISWELVEINEQRDAQEIGEINQLVVIRSIVEQKFTCAGSEKRLVWLIS
jgi:hypothetical protein